LDVGRWAFLLFFMLSAIIVAAGSSRRMGFDKLFAEIAGQPVIAHAISAFERTASVSSIIVVAREDRHHEIELIVRDGSFKKVHAIVKGGEHRQDSVRAGLEKLPVDATPARSARYVAVHDAARPLVTPENIERVYDVAQKHGAAALAAPVSDTLKRADADPFDLRFPHGGPAGLIFVVKESVDRHQLFAMQTPQIFERTILEEAYRAVFAKKIPVTDEVSAVEHAGAKVMLVPNEQPNFKITYPSDLKLAEFVLTQISKSG
jgi:2-C-methyl-D-erythritol 4-phosphate cytidylyltransferase